VPLPTQDRLRSSHCQPAVAGSNAFDWRINMLAANLEFRLSSSTAAFDLAFRYRKVYSLEDSRFI
jgi:hypothetical protein